MQSTMKTKFDKKSLIAGLLVGAAVVVTIAASSNPSSPVGRFQTVINDAGLMVMTDTMTGQAWSCMAVNPGGIKDEEFKKKKLQ